MAQARWDVESHKFAKHGGAGFGEKDIEHLLSLGPSGPTPFQYRQLYQRARQRGKNVSAGVTAMFEGNNIPGVGNIPRELPAVQHAYGQHGGWGFGMEDLRHVTGGDLFSPGHVPRVRELANWASAQGIGVSQDIDRYLTNQAAMADEKKELQISRQLQQQGSDALLALAQKEVPIQEPPKPTMPGPGGHVVSGATRFNLRPASQTRARSSGTKRARFGRAYFSSPLSIGGGGTGGNATSSKVLNV